MMTDRQAIQNHKSGTSHIVDGRFRVLCGRLVQRDWIDTDAVGAPLMEVDCRDCLRCIDWDFYFSPAGRHLDRRRAEEDARYGIVRTGLRP